MTHHLLGVAEIASMLGVTRQRVHQLIQSPDFPPPVAELSAGHIWDRDAVEAWVASHPDRAPDSGVKTFAAYGDAARTIVVRAQEEARMLAHGSIGTEHVLLALLATTDQPGLVELGVRYGDVRADVLAASPRGATAPTGHIPFTARTKQALESATVLATDGPVGERHLLVAVAQLADGLAAAILRARTGLDQDALLAVLEAGDAPEATTMTSVPGTPACTFCGKPHQDVVKLIAGPGVAICNECVDLCNAIIAEHAPAAIPDPKAALRARIESLAAELESIKRQLDD